MGLQIVGKLVELLPEQSGEGRNGVWRKKSFVIETQDQYPKKICLVIWGDRISQLDGSSPGDTLTVDFDLESREYNGRWYTDAKAWRVEAQKTETNQGGQANSGGGTPDDPFPDDMMNSSTDQSDDLPF